MDPIILSATFMLGLLAHRIRLPALAGFIIAGFILHTMGFTASENIKTVGDLGVTLLLFTIGLKLKIKQLLRPEIWATGTIHMVCTVLFFGAIIHGLTLIGFHYFANLSLGSALLLGFALSFSSTVFAVKIMEESGAANVLIGKLAIGILIIQDVLAVIFITCSSDSPPTVWALVVIALLPVARWCFSYILDHTGHGELQVLFGMALALAVGAGVFDLVGLKADLGALVMGMLLATHPRASELSDSLLSIKDFMLIGFFLNIGLEGLPDITTLVLAVLLVLFIPLKSALFLFLFTRFDLSARTSFITSMTLTNYSEFGLIVGAVGVSSGWLETKWLMIIAIALSLSFIAASPLNMFAEELFEKCRNVLKRIETDSPHPDEERIPAGVAWQIIIVGMGRVGTQTYDILREFFGDIILGVDADQEKVLQHKELGRDVIYVDAADGDFWRGLAELGSVQINVLTIPSLETKLYAMNMAKKVGLGGKFIAVTEYDDELDVLREHGADFAFNTYDEVGIGLASDIYGCLDAAGIVLHKIRHIE
ncbi:cation:proton antiporter family protein [Halodesulfovibrio sp.]|uniref:cation:proton antiporter family protein n=1 Tax=Halodesulfovibrio sp. TaxID=1912772 RepID=UPI0025FE053B|nr:cation:proton antiporter family protein [Halodesulfovibrio sp.]MCT4627864.1 cation:proton antiporter [Halodesulfovibrio sp.]